MVPCGRTSESDAKKRSYAHKTTCDMIPFIWDAQKRQKEIWECRKQMGDCIDLGKEIGTRSSWEMEMFSVGLIDSATALIRLQEKLLKYMLKEVGL